MTAPGEDSTGEGFTDTGMAIGTYAYMPPEQARGDIDSQDERADVFALGAVLCKILTGQPTYTGSGLVQQARTADLAACFARLDASGANAELLALAKRCLAKSPADRPRNAQAVLDAVRAHKAVVAARAREERERRVSAEAKAAEERRRRRVTTALAMSVVVVLIVGGGGLWAWQEQRALRQADKTFQAEQNRKNAEETLEHLDKLYERFMWDEAERQLADIDDRVGPEGDADLRKRIAQSTKNAAFLRRLDEIRLEKSLIINGKLNEAGAPAKYRAAFEENGFDILNGDRTELAKKWDALPGSVQKLLLAALDDWAMTTQEEWAKRKEIMAVTAVVTGQTWRTQLMSDIPDDGTRIDKLYEQIPEKQRTPAIIVAVGKQLHNQGKDWIRRIEAGLLQYPGDFWLHFSLGAMCGKGHEETRIGAFRAALAIRPGTPIVLVNLGNAYHLKKDYVTAIATLREAKRLDSNFAMAHIVLGIVYFEKEDYDEAVDAFTKARSLDQNNAVPHWGLGNVYFAKKDYDKALDAYQKASSLDKKNASLHLVIGDVLRAKKQYDKAADEYRTASRLDPKDARPHTKLGALHFDRKQFDLAIEAYSEAIRRDPNNARLFNSRGLAWRENASLFYCRGIAWRAKEANKKAIADYNEAMNDRNFDWPHYNLALLYAGQREYQAAVAELDKAIKIKEDGDAYWELGRAYRNLGRFSESVEALRKAEHLLREKSAVQEDLRLSEEYAELDRRFPAILSGKEQPKSPSDAVRIALFASQGFKKEYALSYRLYTDAFDKDSKLEKVNRYDATCAAVQFAAGHDIRDKPDGEKRESLQKQARIWLTADLAALKQLAFFNSQQALEKLIECLEDSDLNPVRDPEGLKAIPDNEREAWEAGWAEARALFEKLNAP
jgi:tetratricopeptide (TPR) repeat protein